MIQPAKLFSGQISELPISRVIVDRLREHGVESIGAMFSLSAVVWSVLNTLEREEREQFSNALAGMGFIIGAGEGAKNEAIEFGSLDPSQQMKLARSVNSLRLPARARTLFSKLRVEFVGDLIQYSFDELLAEKNVGQTTLTSIQQELEKLGLALGTTLVGWSKRAAARIASSDDGQLEQLRGQEGEVVIHTHLEQQVADLLSRFASEKWVQIAMKFYGFDGSGQKTLEAVGQEFGLTRERIRQITSKMRDRFPQRLKLVSLPSAAAAIDLLEETLPCSVDEVEQALVETGVTATRFDVSGIASLFEFDGEVAPFEIVELEGGTKLLTPLGTGEFVGLINSKAGKLVSRWGVTTVSEVCSQIDSGISSDLVRKVLNGSPDISWLDENRNWFTLVAQKRNRLLTVIQKVLSVASEITVGELRKAVSRSHRMKGFAPPRSVLANFCRAQQGISIREDVVTFAGTFECDEKLGGIERDFFDILTRIGPVARREEIEEECRKIGMNRNSLYVYLSYSPILHRISKGVYGLVGSRYSAADVEALAERNKGRVLLDYGWTSSGLIWVAFQLNASNIRSGIFNIPNAIGGFVPDGVYEIRTGDELLDKLRIKGGVIWGLDKFFDRRGGDIGDIFVIELNASSVTALIEIGGLDLLDRYADEHLRAASPPAAVTDLSMSEGQPG